MLPAKTYGVLMRVFLRCTLIRVLQRKRTGKSAGATRQGNYKGEAQRLKPAMITSLNGTTEVVP